MYTLTKHKHIAEPVNVRRWVVSLQIHLLSLDALPSTSAVLFSKQYTGKTNNISYLFTILNIAANESSVVPYSHLLRYCVFFASPSSTEVKKKKKKS